MSAENVEILREAFDAVNATGDPEPIFALYDSEIEFEVSWRSGRDSSEFRVLHGPAEVRAYVAELSEAFDSFRWDVHEYIDAGDDVVQILEMLACPKGSSAEISTGRFGYVWTLRDGRIVRVQDFPEPGEALAAAGLSTADATTL